MLYRGLLELTPVGPVEIVADNNYIIQVEFYNSGSERHVNYLTKNYPKQSIQEGCPPIMQNAKKQLSEYFMGKRKQFDLPMLLFGTTFQKRCWGALCDIPYGETRTYRQQAEAVHSPKAFRAVGQSNHHNPIAIIIPCHRVIASDGSLGGYGGGLKIKELLLDLERTHL